MNISFLTTWDCCCGIAEYSRLLLEEFVNLGHNVTILGNSNTDYKNTSCVCIADCFGVRTMGQETFFDTEKIISTLQENIVDILHVQYQGALFKEPELNKLVKKVIVEKLVKKVVVTFHDSSRHSKTNIDLYDNIIYHKKGIYKTKVGKIARTTFLLDFPIPYVKPSIISFGLGDRNNKEVIQNVCDELDVSFDYHDSKSQGWLSNEELVSRIKSSDAVVLYYNEVPIIGASSAARTAQACHRPLIVNDVGWFSDLDNVYKVSNEEELKEKLDFVLDISYIKERSYLNCAKKHIEIYERPV